MGSGPAETRHDSDSVAYITWSYSTRIRPVRCCDWHIASLLVLVLPTHHNVTFLCSYTYFTQVLYTPNNLHYSIIQYSYPYRASLGQKKQATPLWQNCSNDKSLCARVAQCTSTFSSRPKYRIFKAANLQYIKPPGSISVLDSVDCHAEHFPEFKVSGCFSQWLW